MSETWRELVSTPGARRGARTLERRLVACYDPVRLRDVLAFVHSEVQRQADVDLYNVQYDDCVASASALEPVDRVLDRLGEGVRRFVLPSFRGRSGSVRVDHAAGRMEATASSIEELMLLRDEWIAHVGGEGSVVFGVVATGRLAAVREVTRVVHVVLGVVAFNGGGVVCVERPAPGGGGDAVTHRVEVPDLVLPCSDCGGYHAPAVAARLRSLLEQASAGTVVLRSGEHPDEVLATLHVPSFVFEFSAWSLDPRRVRDVEGLVTRSLDVRG